MLLGRPNGHDMGALSQHGRSQGMADGQARQRNSSKSKHGIEYRAPDDDDDGDAGSKAATGNGRTYLCFRSLVSPTSELLRARILSVANATCLDLGRGSIGKIETGNLKLGGCDTGDYVRLPCRLAFGGVCRPCALVCGVSTLNRSVFGDAREIAASEMRGYVSRRRR
ncbi:hypothetical protein E0Z10_g7061 [Xylaria hypoxylon]|uniref:Uncharacterized protein n=1 Tax=Xylaria hypoxylon TaxID=37992 RepID=A0A4Z0YRL7_9PEZI|nr:hypothetical protein E0Z10_g7061 [Xylaria hypoxylon]